MHSPYIEEGSLRAGFSVFVGKQSFTSPPSSLYRRSSLERGGVGVLSGIEVCVASKGRGGIDSHRFISYGRGIVVGISEADCAHVITTFLQHRTFSS